MVCMLSPMPYLKLRCLLRPFAVVAVTCSLVPAYASPETSDPAEDRVVERIVTLPFERSAQEHVSYFHSLLELALSKTAAADGPYRVEPYPKSLTGARFLHKLEKQDGIDVIWSMTSADMEKRLRRVPISLLRGLNSYRVFLIREADQEKFAAVASLEDLKAFRAGMVSSWPDTAILKSNGLSVVTSAHYELLFNMLEVKRIDYFPRGLYEVWQEQEANADKGFVIERQLMLHYHGPIYFFVSRDNKSLADRIERGINLAIADGSFDELFFSVPNFRLGYEEMTNSNRRVFRLPVEGPVKPR
jgi:hypothetical protein